MSDSSQQSAIEALSLELIELQSQQAFQEDTILALNNVVTEQQQQIERLNEMVNLLKNQLDTAVVEVSGSGQQERPPHY